MPAVGARPLGKQRGSGTCHVDTDADGLGAPTSECIAGSRRSAGVKQTRQVCEARGVDLVSPSWRPTDSGRQPSASLNRAATWPSRGQGLSLRPYRPATTLASTGAKAGSDIRAFRRAGMLRNRAGTALWNVVRAALSSVRSRRSRAPAIARRYVEVSFAQLRQNCADVRL